MRDILRTGDGLCEVGGGALASSAGVGRILG